jgi:hypothetical protein
MKTENMTTLHLRKSIDRSPLRRGLVLIPFVLVCLAFSPAPNAFGVSPAPDGGYVNENTAEGTNALFNLTTGDHNTATGFEALLSNTTGSGNTATGHNTLQSNTTGYHNTATGGGALASNTTGFENTASGRHALQSNTTGNSNTADGEEALFSNTTGSNNTVNGFEALFSNTTGSNNTADGFEVLASNTTGNASTAYGFRALFNNTTGKFDTATGPNALLSNTTGNSNTANGVNALFSNTTGNGNIALGFQAGFNLTTGSNNIDIYDPGLAGEANTIRIGTVGTQTATFIAGIDGAAVTGAAVVVSSSGQLGVAPSSERFKEAIKPMDKTSEAILALKPVTFRYKHELDPKSIPQFGLVAEEVEKVNPDLAARDADGKVYTVRYEAVNAMLLNEFLKEHRTVQEQGATIAQQQKEIAALAAQLKEQTALIRKVSDRLELSTAPQMVRNNQ